jgi:predicted flap endonuclease-1-like 5' DNA nuclease
VWAFIQWDEAREGEAMNAATRSPKSGPGRSLPSSALLGGRGDKRSHDELQTIPGVGPAVAAGLRDIGVKRVADLKGADPQKLYEKLNARRGVKQDRCVLYTFRCAVYYASRPVHEPEKLKWWNWKDTS